MKFRTQIRNREALAIQADLDIAALECEASPANETIGDVIVVHVRGPLEHHACLHSDSYEALRARFGAALASHPSAVVLRIDSPGGLVSGLNEAVYDMRRAARNEGVTVYAYVDELAASAAYAIACVADEIVIPPSGIAGSVGVISTMCDVSRANEAAGVTFVTLTSGARKADGHVNTPISDDAIAAEQERVDDLAGQFFRIVKESRGIDAKPLEANIYMGMYAVEAGLADVVMGWESLLSSIQSLHSPNGVAAKANTVQPNSPPRTARDSRKSMLKIQALIASAARALKAEGSASKRIAIRAQLDAYRATLAALKAEKKMSPYGGKKAMKDEEDEAEEKKAGGNETDRKEDDMPGDEPSKKDLPASDEEDEEEEEEGDDKPDMADEEDEEEEEEEGSDEEDEKALAALLGSLRGKAKSRAAGALAALVAKSKRADAMSADVTALKRAEVSRKRDALISEKLAGGFITKKAARDLAAKPLSFVAAYLKMQTAKLYVRDGEEFAPAAPGAHGGAFTREQEAMFMQAAATSKGKLTVEQLKANFRNPAASNGIGSRY